MPFDFSTAEQHRGRTNYYDGLAAEETAARHYRDAGAKPLAERWRGKQGELDLIFQEDDGTFVFVEVKKAATFDRACERLTPQKIARVVATAEEYLSDRPNASMCFMRYDAALVDKYGRLEILPNITM